MRKGISEELATERFTLASTCGQFPFLTVTMGETLLGPGHKLAPAHLLWVVCLDPGEKLQAVETHPHPLPVEAFSSGQGRAFSRRGFPQ